MTKLVIGLAVVVVVVLIIVILAVRNMRGDDHEDFGERSGEGSRGRGRRNGSNWRAYDRSERSVRQSARDGRPGLRQGGQPRPLASSRNRSGGLSTASGRVSGGRSGSGHSAGGRGDRSGRGYEDQRMADARDDLTIDDGQRYGSRPGRGKRSDDSADWPSTEWDKLSDVDYWAELASDKPLTTTAQPAARARPALGGQDRDGHTGAGRGGAGDQAPRLAADSGLPVRSRPQFAAAPVPFDAAPVPAPPRPVPAAAQGPDLSATTGLLGGVSPVGGTLPVGPFPGQQYIQGSLDDDPLTSPSFPRVPADDSRSYRSSRTGGIPAGREAAHSAPTQQFASYGNPTAPFGGQGHQGGPPAERANPLAYPDPAPGPGIYRGADQAPAARTDSYQTRSGSYPRPGLDTGQASGVSAAGPLPSGNPYGSYVSAPPGGGVPAPLAQDRSNLRNPSHPSAEDLTGYRSGSYPPAEDLTGYRNGSYPPGQDRSGYGNGWYPQYEDTTLPGSGGHGRMADPGGFGAQPPGLPGGEGHYYPADHLRPGYQAGPQDQGPYLPAGYPRNPSAAQVQDPYAPDGYGGRAGYGPPGR